MQEFEMLRVIKRLILVASLAWSVSPALAEPWISTRYAQNCAGCHAPGRKNLPVADRRCTLSCQGCHVSPSGGGLRSYYGKWNEDRWLRSITAKSLGHAQNPVAPITLQKYGPKRKDEYRKGAKAPKGGFPLAELKSLVPDSKEVLYDRRDKLEKQTADREQFEYQIPVNDPYRLMDLNKIDAGADLRWQFRRKTIDASAIDTEGNSTQILEPTTTWSSFPMVMDAQFGLRPFHRKLRLVYELRAQRAPGKTNPDDLGKPAGRRSLYAMVEDLPFNLYVQGGYYRPLFGYYTPDHTFLPQQMMATALGISAYNQEFLTYSFGGSPNLPYVNLHYIVRETANDRPISGFAGNFGVRFVTKGISVNYSIWKLTDSANKNAVKEYLFQSLFASIQLGPITYSLDLESLEKNDPDVALLRGGVYSMDAYFQLYRAIYANAQYAYANSAPDLYVGKTSQLRAGLRSFLAAGTDISLMYERESSLKQDTAGNQVLANLNGIVGQIHLFM
jgi:hypothetical protein